MAMDYKYIEQLLECYFECQTSLEEEKILRAFFAQENIPAHLLPYREMFAEQVWSPASESLGSDFDARILSVIGQEEENQTIRVKAKRVSINRRLRPLYKAVACVAIVLAIGQAAQMPYSEREEAQRENLAKSLQQLQQFQKDRNAVAQSDSAATTAKTAEETVLSN